MDETSRDRMLFNENQKLGKLCSELERSAKVWQTEYMRVLAFSGYTDSSVKALQLALEKVGQLLDMQPNQNAQIQQAAEEIESALSLAKRCALNAPTPVPLYSEAASQDAFNWYLELELGLTATRNQRSGTFEDPAIQARYEGYMVGAKLGFSQAVREYKARQVDSPVAA